jgi:phospholipid/cholesterol/gamma-HCH transport system substrate-binding protein
MNARTSYILVGLFVLGLGTAFVAGILWLGSGSAGRDYNTYVVFTTESVAGLSRDGVVKYRGVDVGRVSSIDLDRNNPEKVRLLLEIQKGTPIKQDTVATLEVRGLTGLAYVNLAGGSQESPPLVAREGAPYPQIPSRPSIWGRLDQNFGTLLENLVEASNRLNTWLSDENRELLIRTLSHLEKLSSALAQRSDSLDQALQDLSQTLHNTRVASDKLPALVADLERGSRAFERMANEFEKAGSVLGGAISARDRDVQRFTADALPEAATMISDLRQTAANLRQLSEALKRDPGVLLRGTAPEPPGPGEQEPTHP